MIKTAPVTYYFSFSRDFILLSIVSEVPLTWHWLMNNISQPVQQVSREIQITTATLFLHFSKLVCKFHVLILMIKMKRMNNVIFKNLTQSVDCFSCYHPVEPKQHTQILYTHTEYTTHSLDYLFLQLRN